MARILCIEDDALSLHMLHKFLATAGHDVLEATDGVTGVILAAQSMPDLILMDINLPGMNGLEVTRSLKSTPQLAGIPVIAVTAHVMHSERKQVFEAGCDGFLPKPLYRNILLETVADMLIHSGYSANDQHPL